MTEYYREVKRRREAGDPDAPGFTLIELLIVIVVLGILAATVIFALGGVTGSSAQASCNSDAKSLEVAIQAYEDSSTNATNAAPTTKAQLVPQYLRTYPSSSHYNIYIGGDTNNATTSTNPDYDKSGPQGTSGVVYVTPPGVAYAAIDTTKQNYDSTTNPCDLSTIS